ncbi:serine/threonine protein kinase [Nocardia uniformis]|uniref:non-specific serine/threonine protein kinase n=1 Tax=Nocardia uniformis TaxID=53432 RepID=A0A849C674_9NOCA|nr:serine/threonine-protein kinase [Nocardia uniformis]NNH74184.1 serine/threonine protein kinase [Nocardia uniformis]
MRGPVVQLGVNESFAGYQVERMLGQGGMGSVYLAAHPRLPRKVALKLLNRDVSADEEMRRRFDREANVIARLDHPGIVSIQDRGVQDGHLWIAMQYVHGTDAARVDPRTVSVDRALRIISQTGAALDYAHSCGILHRDVKPANILLSTPETGREERAVLTDFGIASLADNNTQLTATGIFSATLAFASPEQLSGERVDHRADQYSLACTLFALLTGQGPFSATNPGQVVAGHLSKPVPRLSQVRGDVPAALDDVIARAAAKDRNARFGSCTEFAAAAMAALHGRVPTAHRQGPAPTRTIPVVPQSPTPGSTAFATRRAPAPDVRRAPADRPPAGVSAPPRNTNGPAVAAATMALACAAMAVWFVFELSDPYGGVGRLPEVVRNLGYTDSQVLVAATVCTAFVTLLLVGGAIRLLMRRRKGRIMTVLGSLGFIVGAAGSHLAVRYFGGAAYGSEYRMWLHHLLLPLLDPLAVAGGAIGIVLAIGAIGCTLAVRR